MQKKCGLVAALLVGRRAAVDAGSLQAVEDAVDVEAVHHGAILPNRNPELLHLSGDAIREVSRLDRGRA